MFPSISNFIARFIFLWLLPLNHTRKSEAQWRKEIMKLPQVLNLSFYFLLTDHCSMLSSMWVRQMRAVFLSLKKYPRKNNNKSFHFTIQISHTLQLHLNFLNKWMFWPNDNNNNNFRFSPQKFLKFSSQEAFIHYLTVRHLMLEAHVISPY